MNLLCPLAKYVRTVPHIFISQARQDYVDIGMIDLANNLIYTKSIHEHIGLHVITYLFALPETVGPA